MALDLEEQEKLDELKSWWSQYGNMVVAFVVAVALSVAAWQGWRWHRQTQAVEAGALYETLARAAQADDAKALRDAGGTLVEKYPGTPYASMAALVSARYYYDKNDLKSAKAQLQWTVDKSASDDFRDLARLRLAAVLLDEKAHDEALKLLEAKHGAAYDALYAALRGDVLVAKNQAADAKQAYQLALEKSGGADAQFRESVRMRLEALGG